MTFRTTKINADMEPPKKKLKQTKSRFIIYSESEIVEKNDAAKNIPREVKTGQTVLFKSF